MIRFLLYTLLTAALAAVVVPNFVRARVTRSQSTCVDSVLPKIASAKRLWARTGTHATSETPSWTDLRPWLVASGVALGTNGAPACFAGGDYTINPLNRPPVCSQTEHTREFLRYHQGSW
jgi:hypothetical protein